MLADSPSNYEREADANAGRTGSDYRRTRREVDRTTRLTVHLAEGGGWAARPSPKN